MIIRLATASAAALTLAACAAEDTPDTPAAEETGAMAAATDAPAAEAPDPGTPQGFVATAASSDMYEIEAGRLAQDTGSSQEVKDFGAMMVRDHTTSSNNLKQAVAEGGAGLSVPPSMLPKHQQQLDALRNAGGNFDNLYIQQQTTAHQEALTLLQRQAETGTVASLKAFAAKTAPVVEGHLEHVRGMAGGTGGAE